MDTTSPRPPTDITTGTTIQANLDPYIVVQVNAASREEANQIAHAVVDGGLAGAVQIAAVRTRYRWQGTVQEANEHVITMFTRRECFEAVAACVHAYHSYDVPQIVALPVVASTAPFLHWIDESTRPCTSETP